MELLFNELSVHEQFHDKANFRDALLRLIAMRNTARRFQRKIRCNRMLLGAKPMPDTPMQQAIEKLGLPVDKRRAVMIWLSQNGLFWDDTRQHSSDDWFEHEDKIVTDTAVGEAAFRALHGMNCGLVSFSPSDWECTPVEVIWRRTNGEPDGRDVELENWWDARALEETLRGQAPLVRSWDDLRQASGSRFNNLTFAADCFAPLEKCPFNKSKMKAFIKLLNTLDQFACAFDESGRRSAEGHRIYKDYFTGDKAWFSDSSDSEKHDFREKLTFKHPENRESSLFCTWHGKVAKTFRLHFSWPIKAGESVYVVYAGPKLTKQ